MYVPTNRLTGVSKMKEIDCEECSEHYHTYFYWQEVEKHYGKLFEHMQNCPNCQRHLMAIRILEVINRVDGIS